MTTRIDYTDSTTEYFSDNLTINLESDSLSHLNPADLMEFIEQLDEEYEDNLENYTLDELFNGQ